MADAFNSVLPVATLIIGAGMANFLRFSELRMNLRRDAADRLAELPGMLWNRTDPDAWLKANAATAQLVIRMNLAGVHPDLTGRFEEAAIGFWRSVHQIGRDEDGEIWVASETASESWTEISGLVAELLGTNSRIKAWWIGRRARSLLGKWDVEEATLLSSVTGD